jgi:hypothetical protein
MKKYDTICSIIQCCSMQRYTYEYTVYDDHKTTQYVQCAQV